MKNLFRSAVDAGDFAKFVWRNREKKTRTVPDYSIISKELKQKHPIEYKKARAEIEKTAKEHLNLLRGKVREQMLDRLTVTKMQKHLGEKLKEKKGFKTLPKLFQYWHKKLRDFYSQNSEIFARTTIRSFRDFIDQNATEEFKKEHALLPTIFEMTSSDLTSVTKDKVFKDKEENKIPASRANEYMKQLFEMFEKWVEEEKRNPTITGPDIVIIEGDRYKSKPRSNTFPERLKKLFGFEE